MAQAQSGNTVKVHYTGKLEDGTIFDSSVNREPLEFQLGQGQMIQGFEQAVYGMAVGESKTATIPVEQAYGPKSEDMILEVNRSEVPADLNPQVGQQLAIQQPDGHALPVTVTSVTDQTITLDANHPLAGKDLIFEIKVVEIN
jgi:peptidylprolyl isomerase